MSDMESIYCRESCCRLSEAVCRARYERGKCRGCGIVTENRKENNMTEEKKTETPRKRLIIDFSQFPELMEQLELIARQNVRSPQQEILYRLLGSICHKV